MKKYIIVAILCIPIAAFGWGIGLIGSGGGSADTGFCSGTFLFCADFETQDMITWDTTPATEDTTGTPPWDAQGDWSDYINYTPCPLIGNYSAYIMGGRNDVLGKIFSEQSEFYLEMTIRTTEVGTIRWMNLFDGASYIIFRVSANVIDVYNFAVTTSTDMDPNVNNHFGLYFKAETDSGSNNGTLQMWLNTDGSDFDAGDLIWNENGDKDTYDFVFDQVQFVGGEQETDTEINFFDNIKIISGACPWPTS